MESFLDILRDWNKSVSEREKLQHLYVCIIVIATVIAGLTALINPELGHQLIMITLIAVTAFLANALVWALARVYLFDRLDRRRTTKK